MPDLELFVVADAVVIDQRTDRLSIFNVLDQLRPRRFPARVTRVVALSTWLLSDADQGEDFQVLLAVTGPLGEQPNPFAQNFTGAGRGQRIIHQLVGGLVIDGPGELRFETRLNGVSKAHHSILIHEADPSEPAEGMLLYRPDASGQNPGG
jgi:hypothetical protein